MRLLIAAALLQVIVAQDIPDMSMGEETITLEPMDYDMYTEGPSDTMNPSNMTTWFPTNDTMTDMPTEMMTDMPTESVPTRSPSVSPSRSPSSSPSKSPTREPSRSPSEYPTSTADPTMSPTTDPTLPPADGCALCDEGTGTADDLGRLVIGPDGAVTTCQDLDTIISLRPPGKCDYDGTLGGIDVQAFCGCPDSDYPEVCPGVCPNGEAVVDGGLNVG